MMDTLITRNNAAVPMNEIPELSYDTFLSLNTGLMTDPSRHCVQYFGFRVGDTIRLLCCIADDHDGSLHVSSARVHDDLSIAYPSFTAHHLSFHIFERVLHEQLGMRFSDHPWLKPVRFPFNRVKGAQQIADYPFFRIEGEELHEVGVGPIHAGIIEPGHFRFMCNGEQILHLEIQLGFQHRGIEDLFLQKKKLLQRVLLAESIAGDSVAGHTSAFSSLWESLCGYVPGDEIVFSRTVAMELERIAMHTGDLSAMCTDIGYQLGSAVFGRLRTPLINFFQEWCGNRLAKGLIRPGENPFYFSHELGRRLGEVLDEYETAFDEMWDEFHTLPSVLARLEKTGVIPYETAVAIGAVGMTARATGLHRDIRTSHPHRLYAEFSPIAIVKHHGDVYSRAQLRHDEIVQSLYYLRKVIRRAPPENKAIKPTLEPRGGATLAISLTEGWRGEICHCAVTDESGELIQYRVKDPSLHNWLAVALAVRNNDISDFPICNKSFNLSYCGHDL